ncbi:MAG: hypothetical protein EHM54_09155 [Nitrospiraceae bacterium]|nr:MAG: hypothetical protein EHM54_09155 [Nitrospiraceae bacterium]
MNIGIIGAGNIGSGLGKIWAKKGHKIIFSFSRNPEKLGSLQVLLKMRLPARLLKQCGRVT